jgi:prolipoprotein diacylglyceryltransferase
MKLLAFILIMSAVAIGVFVKKENQRKMQIITHPLLGLGLILAGVGNFMTGEMIGKESHIGFTNSVRDTVWTLESDPLPFILSSSALILGGIALLVWVLFLRKK